MSSLPSASATSRIAYLTSEYPAVSHTFILREVEALRDLGRDVITCSIRQTAAHHHRGPSEKAAAQNTFYVLRSAKSPKTLAAALWYGVRRPKQLGRAVSSAWGSRAPGLKSLLYQGIYLIEAMVLAHHLTKQNVTRLHNHFGNASATVAMLAGQLADIPFSYTVHGPTEFYSPKTLALHQKTAAADFVACISHFCRSQAMNFSHPDHWSKLRIIHCGILPDQYDTSKIPHEGLRLLFVGRLSHVKGVRVLIDALKEIRKTNPEVTLTLIGDGDDRPDLEKSAQHLGEAVTFLGYKSQSEVAEALREADALVLPSFAEGLPVVLMEALASSTPVICTQLAGVGELVEDGVSGFLVPPGDSLTLADRIRTIAEDPELRTAMGRAGRKKVTEEFDVRQEAARMASVFDGCAIDGPRPEPVKA